MPTINDVARLAGVSTATVSNFLNNTKPVSEVKAEKIASAIEQIGYTQNAMAKLLKSGKSNEIGVILPNISDNYYAQIYSGIEAVLDEKNLYPSLSITHDIEILERNYFDNFLRRHVAGIFLVSCQPQNREYFSRLLSRPSRTALIHIDRQIDLPSLSFLSFNCEDAIHSLTTDLLMQGAKKLLLLTGPEQYSCERDAANGFRRAITEFPCEGGTVLHTPLNKEAAFRTSLQRIYTEKPDAIITTSQSVLNGVTESVNVSGYKIGRDILVASLGEDNWNTFGSQEKITLSRRQAIKLGSEAADLLCREIEAPKVYEPKIRIINDKYHALERKKNISCNKKLRVLMLDTLQVKLFEGLLPLCSQQVEIIKKPHTEILNTIYSDNASYDVVMYDMPWLYSLAKDKMLSDIGSYISEINTDMYLNSCIDSFGRFDGNYYGMPFMYAPQILFYRKDLFENKSYMESYRKKYNIKLRSPRTWTEFNTISSFFTKSINPRSETLFGTAVAGAYAQCLAPEIYMRLKAYGGRIFDDSFNVVFDSPQNVNAYANLLELIQNYSPDFLKHTDQTVVDEFLNDRAAMLITYPSFISDINDLQHSCLSGKVGFSHIPGARPILGGWGLGVSVSCKHKREAFEFIAWACGSEICNYSTILAGQSAISEAFENNELISLYPWLPLCKSAFDYARPVVPPYKRGNKIIPQEKIDSIITSHFYSLVSKNGNAEQCVKDTHCDIAALFASYNY